MPAAAKAQALPGMEHRVIPALEDAGATYAEIRDKRIALNTEEAELKKNVRALMRKHKKIAYESASISITLEPPDGEDQVKVKIKKAKNKDNE